MAEIEGSNFLIQVSTDSGSSYTAIGCQADTEINFNGSAISVVCKNSGSWGSSSIGAFSWDATFQATFDVSHTYGAEEAFAAFKAKTLLDWRWVQVDANGDPVVGGPQIDGTARIQTMTIAGPAEDGFVTYNVSLTGSGEPTLTLVST